MSGLGVLVFGALAALVVLLIFKDRADARGRASFLRISEAAARASQRPPRAPNMRFAAEGFVGVALMRKSNISIDLHAVERGNAEHHLKNGCTLDQALSARWGGAVAIHADLDQFQAGIDAYEATKLDLGRGLSGEDPKTKYHVAATLYLGQMLAGNPGEYERFLHHINA